MTLPFRVREAGPVRLTLVDVLGREVATLADGPRAAGAHRVRLDVSGLAAGVYVLRLVAGDKASARSILVQR